MIVERNRTVRMRHLLLLPWRRHERQRGKIGSTCRGSRRTTSTAGDVPGALRTPCAEQQVGTSTATPDAMLIGSVLCQISDERAARARFCASFGSRARVGYKMVERCQAAAPGVDPSPCQHHSPAPDMGGSPVPLLGQVGRTTHLKSRA